MKFNETFHETQVDAEISWNILWNFMTSRNDFRQGCTFEHVTASQACSPGDKRAEPEKTGKTQKAVTWARYEPWGVQPARIPDHSGGERCCVKSSMREHGSIFGRQGACDGKIVSSPVTASDLQHKLLKNCQGTLSSSFSFWNHPTIVLFRTGAPKHGLIFSYQWTSLTVEASMFRLQNIILS
jgi:hypothetical protein